MSYKSKLKSPLVTKFEIELLAKEKCNLAKNSYQRNINMHNVERDVEIKKSI